MSRARVLVLGDMVADEYVIGRPGRVSREAPVLILEHAERFVRPGGATNTANNARALGARATVVGVVGDDEIGRQLRSALEAAGVDVTGLISDPNRPTSTKTRILGKGTQEIQQQIVRIDRIDRSDLAPSVRHRMIDLARKLMESCDALIISDYENGVISTDVLDACLPEARRRSLLITIDSHGDLLRFRGITTATPNQPEAEATLGRSLEAEADLRAGGAELLAGMEAESVLITRGSQGVALFHRGDVPLLLPATRRREMEVVDPTGAGDTVAAVFTLALFGGCAPPEAALGANVAGGEVVRKAGAATLSPDELAAALAVHTS